MKINSHYFSQAGKVITLDESFYKKNTETHSSVCLYILRKCGKEDSHLLWFEELDPSWYTSLCSRNVINYLHETFCIAQLGLFVPCVHESKKSETN